MSFFSTFFYFSPLQGQGLKRKYQSSNEQQATANTKKVKTDTHCKCKMYINYTGCIKKR